MPKIILKKQSWFFDGKEEEEDVILVLHRHWITLTVKILLVFLFVFLPFVLLVVFSSIIVKYNLIAIYSFLWITYYLFLWFWLFYVITMFSLDNWVVTTKRVVDSLQTGFFNRRVAELQLDKIQDVSYKIQGLFPTFFNYGVVEIQTAGKDNKFFFEQIPDPQRVKDVIMELIIEEEEEDENQNIHNSVNGPNPRRQHGHVMVKDHGTPTPIVTEIFNKKNGEEGEIAGFKSVEDTGAIIGNIDESEKKNINQDPTL